MFNNQKLATALRMKRAQLKITGTEAAKQIGVTWITVSRLENEKTPDVNTLDLVCRWLDVSTAIFFD